MVKSRYRKYRNGGVSITIADDECSTSSDEVADIDTTMQLQLDKINPSFRQIVDLLFFSDRMDLDLSGFKVLLSENYGQNIEYLWDRFTKSSQICWTNGQSFWENRLTFLLSLNDKTITRRIDQYLEKRMFSLVRTKYDVDMSYDIEYLQFYELCKIKHANNETLDSVARYLTQMTAHMRVEKLIGLLNAFIPMAFSNIDEYIDVLINNITYSCQNYTMLAALEAKGVAFDKQPLLNLAKELILERERKVKHCRALFILMQDPFVMEGLKKEYTVEYRKKLLGIARFSEFYVLDEFHCQNFKNIIALDPTMADELAIIYLDKVYALGSRHKHANADKIISLLKKVPQISQKKILVYLSGSNRMADIRYVVKQFPELQKLAAFI